MKNLTSFLFILFGVLSSAFVQHEHGTTDIDVIVIDAGHGGKDPGCHGQFLHEKRVTLELALRLGKMLKDSIPGVKIIYTRASDRFVPLWQRANIANKNNADLFISLHCNANRNHEASGTETYVMGLHKTDENLSVSKRENATMLLEDNFEDNQYYMGYSPNSSEGHIIMSLFQNAHLHRSLRLAETVQSEFERELPIRNRGVKQAGFVVLWRSSMPSILVETGFLTNKTDEEILAAAKGKLRITQSITRAVRKYKAETEKLALR